MKTLLKIAIIGVPGWIGNAMMDEALKRGHYVTGVVSIVDSVTTRKNLTLKVGNIDNPESLGVMLKDHDLIISNLKIAEYEHDKLVKAIRLSGVKRYILAGSESTLEVTPGITTPDSGKLTRFVLPVVTTGQNHPVDPKIGGHPGSALLPSGAEFTAAFIIGKYRFGTHELIVDENGNNAISAEDFAIALLNEMEG